MCGVKTSLQLHHKTYERIGCEELDDLQPLCQICHTLIHQLRDRKLIPDLDPKHLAYEKQISEVDKPKPSGIKQITAEIRRKKPNLSRKQARHLAQKQIYRNERDLVSSQSRPLL